MNIQENITKESNLDIDDSLSSFRGGSAQQSHLAYQVFYNFLIKIKPSRILEIGTAMGGFTQFLKIVSDEENLNFQLLSYDIAERPWYNQIIETGVDIRVENIFNEDWTGVNQEVFDFINQEGITIVLCDGGWKIGEFKVLSKLIKNGDFILAHDYAENEEVFQEKIYKKIWNWCEIKNSDILPYCVDNNLQYYDKDEFEGAAWTCRVKSVE
jgi:cephalosporin hydroxylase